MPLSLLDQWKELLVSKVPTIIVAYLCAARAVAAVALTRRLISENYSTETG